jgi:hypothetical protein
MKSEPNADHERPIDWRKLPRKCTTRLVLKPKYNAVLEHLTYQQRQTLNDWLLNHPLRLEDIKERIFDEFGIRTSIASISKYFRRYCYQELIRRRESVKEAEEIEKHSGKFFERTMDALAAKTWREARKENATPKELKLYVDLVSKYQELKLKEVKVDIMLRRLRLMEKKAAALEKSMQKSRLSDEQFLEKMRGVFNRETSTSNGRRLLE